MTTPNPKRDKRSAWAWLKDWVDETEHPLSTWVFLVAALLMLIAFAFFLMAIWMGGDSSRKFGNTGGLILGLSIVVGFVAVWWKS
jgi:hypothetical protein